MSDAIPATERAVQLIGPDELELNVAKPVPEPGPHQILCRVEVCGLCFSDLKVLKQFTGHVRKSEVVSGIDLDILQEIPSYVPGEQATVPGHEPVVTIAKVGSEITRFQVGERYLVQADWRWVRTATSNGAFGYNFEGALQEYVLLDERIIISPDGESMLMPASDERSAAAIALVEPWACVEESYQVRERRTLKAGGRLLVVSEADVPEGAMARVLGPDTTPAAATVVGTHPVPGLGATGTAQSVDELPDAAFDDVLYFGSSPGTVEKLFSKVAANGLFLIMLCGGELGRDVTTALGRVHYGGIRIAGSDGNQPADALKTIPATGEIREGNAIHVVGAGGPMGVMHVIRNLCQGVAGVTVVAADLSDERLAALDRIAHPTARRNNVEYCSYNPRTAPFSGAFDYVAVMAPVPQLVAQAVSESNPGGIINIFAGIPAAVTGEIDMDAYVRKGLYAIGTSGSTMEDMKIVRANVESGRLDTNVSVAAVSGLEGAVAGIRMVENQEVPGKIMVYPTCKGLEVTALSELAETMPEVADKLADGVWTQEAEEALLARYET
jgi:L-sorbose 1-phosphate reductase